MAFKVQVGPAQIAIHQANRASDPAQRRSELAKHARPYFRTPG